MSFGTPHTTKNSILICCGFGISTLLACLAGATEQSPINIRPLLGIISTVSVTWDANRVLPTEINPEDMTASLQHDTIDYLRAYGLYRPKTSPENENLLHTIILKDPALKPGRKTSFNRFMRIPILSGNVTLTDLSGKTLQQFDISIQKTDSLQTSRDGGPWSWLSLRFARYIAEGFHPPANGAEKSAKDLPDSSPAVGTARVVVYRQGSLWQLAVRPMIILDGTELGIIGPKKIQRVDLSPGKHTVAAIWNGTISEDLATPPRITDFLISTGETAYFEFIYAEGAFEHDVAHNKEYREIKMTLDPVPEARARPIAVKLGKKKS